MKTNLPRLLLAAILAATLSPQPSTVLAQVPETLSYQGRVSAFGTNFTGTGQFKFALVSAGVNVSRPATATATVVSGFIVSFTVTDGGAGYLTAPAVVISDPTGSGAAATAHVNAGVVTNITVNPGGNGNNYSATPSVTVGAPPPSLVYETRRTTAPCPPRSWAPRRPAWCTRPIGATTAPATLAASLPPPCRCRSPLAWSPSSSATPISPT